jgi:hypothetical protein
MGKRFVWNFTSKSYGTSQQMTRVQRQNSKPAKVGSGNGPNPASQTLAVAEGSKMKQHRLRLILASQNWQWPSHEVTGRNE